MSGECYNLLSFTLWMVASRVHCVYFQKISLPVAKEKRRKVSWTSLTLFQASLSYPDCRNFLRLFFTSPIIFREIGSPHPGLSELHPGLSELHPTSPLSASSVWCRVLHSPNCASSISSFPALSTYNQLLSSLLFHSAFCVTTTAKSTQNVMHECRWPPRSSSRLSALLDGLLCSYLALCRCTVNEAYSTYSRIVKWHKFER